MEAWFKKYLVHGKQWFFETENPSIVDIHVFTISERLILMENSPWNDLFVKLDVKNRAPTIYKFAHEFRDLPMFKE